jgi:hypothetical protein
MRMFRLSMILLSIVTHPLAASAQQMARTNAVVAPVPAGSVTLPLAEYNRLVDLSARSTRPPDAPPVGAVLARADLRLRVDALAVRGAFTFEGEVLRAGATRVELMKSGTVLDARAAGRPVPLVADDGRHAAIVSGPATFSIALDWAAPLRATPGRASFTLPVPAAGSVRAAIDLPGDDVDVRVAPGLITRRTSTAGRTVADVTLDPGSEATVSWSLRPTTSAPAPRDARLLADVLTLVTIAQSGRLTLTLNDSTARHHQFLVALERPSAGGSFNLETGFPSVPAAERERGEIAVEGVGTLDLTAPERPGIRRVDVREINPALVSLARQPLASAFRYRRTASAPPSLTLDVQRFPDAAVLAAVAERAVATTLVNPQGRSLTEIVLRLQNRAQSFMKVEMPQGASIVSVEVGGQPAKPATATDGIRVPLLRPGFRTNGPYTVSFVYVHDGTPFARKGEQRMVLPKMDIPVGVMEWEVFVPEQFSVSRFGGNMIAADLIGGVGLGGAYSGAASGRAVEESVTVVSEQPTLRERDQTGAQTYAPSQNVVNLQQKASGVLPVRMDVPRAGSSLRFVKPLVVDQEPVVSFRYKRR